MLAAPNDFGYSPAHHHAMGGYEQHHHQQSGERPKLFLDGHGGSHLHGGVHHPGMGEYMVNGHAAMTPQQHHQGGDFDHEPLMMNMHNPQSHFYPAMGQQMLHVSTDYASSMDGTTPSARNNSKRSREDLNLKEKKRMFKLNDRINQLKVILDEAGVQSKKNKQSILDNTYHYVGMLRSNLLIAKQKAERAEKQAEAFRNQAQKGGSAEADSMFKRCFQQSSTARLLVDLAFEPVLFNSAFVHLTGLNDDDVKSGGHSLRASLCLDAHKLDALVKICKEGKSMSTVVQARTASGVSTVTLVASPMVDDMGKVSNIEFTLIPLDGDVKAKSEGQDSGANLEL